MFERIRRSIELVKASWRILMSDKKLLVFPILSSIVTIFVIASFVLPLIFTGGAFSLATNSIAGIILIFLFYLVTSFVVIFFNVGLISCVCARLQGNEMTIGEGLSSASHHIRSIFEWAVISATVGLILKMIEDRAGSVGGIATALVGGAWSLVTFFVVPVFVFEEKGITDAIKESWSLFRKTWGESVVGTVSISLLFVAIGIIACIIVLATLFLGNSVVFLSALALFIILIAILAVVASAMQGIFVAILYMYAKNGVVPDGVNRNLISGAFSQAPSTRFIPGNI